MLDSIPPKKWGNTKWKSIRWTVECFPKEQPSEQEKRMYLDYFHAEGRVLPCEMCRNHFNNYLQRHPVDTSSRDSLKKWMYGLYKDTTKQPNLSYNEFLKRTSDSGGGEYIWNVSTTVVGVIVVIIGVSLYYIYINNVRSVDTSG